MSRVLLLLVALLFSVPSVGAAQDDIVKCSWWGPFTAVGTDMDQMTAMEEASGLAKDGLNVIKTHLPEGQFVNGYRQTHKWSRGKNGEHILTITYFVQVCEWQDLPIPELPKKNRRF